MQNPQYLLEAPGTVSALSAATSTTTDSNAPPGQRFELGSIIVTPEAYRALQRFGVEACSLLHRHAAGDWGDLDPLDRRTNERALLAGDRLVSVYVLRSPIGAHGLRNALWLVTEGDRKFTTLLLQDESWQGAS